MKRILGLLLCALVVALVACSDDSLLTGGSTSYNTTGGSDTGMKAHVTVIEGNTVTKDTTIVIGR